MPSYTVVFTEAAGADLLRIREHIAETNSPAASRIAVRIVAACDRLEHFPWRGRAGRVAGTRELTTAWPYVIVYRIAAGRVDILRVWHGAQDR